MGQILLLAIAAAAASALLAAGAAQGQMAAVPLFYLSPLPLMIAGIAFSPVAAGLGVVLACVGLGLTFGHTFLLGYAFGIAVPAFGLSYAAMMAQPNARQPETLDWFPVGTLVLMAALLGTLSVWVTVFTAATDYDAYVALMTERIGAVFGALEGSTADEQVAAARWMAHLLPPLAGLLTMLSQLGCLYLAGRAARLSGRLNRPWPVISDLRLPRPTLMVLVGGVALSLLEGFLGIAGSVAAATALFSFSLAGFAVVHAITVGFAGRPIVLVGLWLTTLVLGWPVLAMAVLGLTDFIFDFRSRLAGGLPPAPKGR